MEDCTSNAVTAFAAVELSQRGSALGFVVNIGQRVQGFIDTTELCNGLRQPGRPVANLERTHDAGGGHPAEFE